MKLTVGLIGLTHPHSAGYLRTLDLCNRVTDVIACDPDPEVCRRVVHEHAQVRETCFEPRALLDRADVPMVLVARPTDEVPEAVIAAARAGKHVFFFEEFVKNALDGEGSPFATVEDAQRVPEILDAAYASAKIGQVVYLNR